MLTFHLKHLGNNTTKVMYVSFSGCRVFICTIYLPITGGVNLGHLIKVVSATFLHCHITILHFIINTYFVRACLETT